MREANSTVDHSHPVLGKTVFITKCKALLIETKLLSSSAQNVRDTTKNLKHLATKRKSCAPDNVWSFCLQDLVNVQDMLFSVHVE